MPLKCGMSVTLSSPTGHVTFSNIVSKHLKYSHSLCLPASSACVCPQHPLPESTASAACVPPPHIHTEKSYNMATTAAASGALAPDSEDKAGHRSTKNWEAATQPIATWPGQHLSSLQPKEAGLWPTAPVCTGLSSPDLEKPGLQAQQAPVFQRLGPTWP